VKPSEVSEFGGLSVPDWIEHVAETGGEPYLHMRDDDMSFLQRHGLFLIGHALFSLVLIRLGMRFQGTWSAKAPAVATSAAKKNK
jgi:hypothetical protein